MHRSIWRVLCLLLCLLTSQWLSSTPPLALQTSAGLRLLAPTTQPITIANSCPADHQVAWTEFCTHGNDPAPVGYAIERQVPPLLTARRDPVPVICDGDGVSGQRIQVLYVRTAEAPNRYENYLPSIRTWVAEVDAIFAASAQVTGGVRHLRFVTDAACQVVVLPVEVATGEEETFAALIAALDKLGHNRRDRKYLLFVDAKVLCGTGTILYDSQLGPENINNTQSGYARVDNGCWGAKPIAHELIHTLGGVQHDAPHSSRGWHCTDEYDIMCYSDSPHHPKVDFLCTDASHETRLDCNHDDYFHTHPAANTYLATHWNVAQSGFLIATEGPSPPPALTLLAPTAPMTFTTPATLTLTAQAADRDGWVQRVEFYQGNQLLATVITPTYSYTWSNVPTGVHMLYAKAYDNVGASQTSASVAIVVTDPDGLINHARGKIASQASTASEQVAGRAVDGNPRPELGGSSTAQTLVQAQPWWQVDLATAVPLEKLRIWGNAICCDAEPISLEILIAARPIPTQTWASVLQQPGIDHYQLAGNRLEPLTLPLKPGQQGRYVLIGALTTTALALTEVEVWVRPETAPVGGQEGPILPAGTKIYLPVVAHLSP